MSNYFNRVRAVPETGLFLTLSPDEKSVENEKHRFTHFGRALHNTNVNLLYLHLQSRKETSWLLGCYKTLCVTSQEFTTIIWEFEKTQVEFTIFMVQWFPRIYLWLPPALFLFWFEVTKYSRTLQGNCSLELEHPHEWVTHEQRHFYWAAININLLKWMHALKLHYSTKVQIFVLKSTD